MGNPPGKSALSDLQDLFSKVDHTVALIALVLTYLSSFADKPHLSIIFVVIACVSFDLWLWRLANARIGVELVAPGGQTRTRSRFTPFQSLVIRLLALSVTLGCVVWIVQFPLPYILPPPPSQKNFAMLPSCDRFPLEWNNSVCVPAGSFVMGSDSGSEDARPAHSVTLSAYWIDKTEVTIGQYDRFLTANPDISHPAKWNTWNTTLPAAEITWDNAERFCIAEGKRLPTEAQWEKAARGPDGRVYPWGNDFDKGKTNSAQSLLGQVTQIGAFVPGASPYGALDMAGNVKEWVYDLYDSDYYKLPGVMVGSINPRGPDNAASANRVVRGGSFADAPNLLRTFEREGVYPPQTMLLTIGFRCVRTP